MINECRWIQYTINIENTDREKCAGNLPKKTSNVDEVKNSTLSGTG